MADNVKEWYNEFTVNQLKTAINLRHYTLINKIVNSGLKRNSKVLEIGCGIGTLTGLIYKYLNKGFILAVDISDESIKIAKSRIGFSERIKYMVTDMSNFSYSEKFDFVILPDVMEHIPVEQHNNLFKVISSVTNEQSKIIIHIPHPKAIEYLQKTAPLKLQIIDQALGADKLINDAYDHGFVLKSYNSYSLFSVESDYVYIELVKDIGTTITPKLKFQIIISKFIQRLTFFWSTF